MMRKDVQKEYKRGREKNFFLREYAGVYYFEKITKACGFTIKCGTKEEITNYIKANGYTFVGLRIMA